MALINLRNALMAGKRLPYDAEVEYLECAGTSSVFPYINTGIVGDSNTTYEAMLWRNTRSTNECAIGSWNSGNTRCWVAYYFGNKFYLGMGAQVNSDGAPQPNVWYKQILKIESSNFNLYVDDELTATVPQTTFTSSQPLYIGAMNSSGTASFYFRGRFGAVKIYQNGVLVRDFIPVRKGAVGYLYDRVSGKLFGNAGTGDFVLGPDVVPVEYLQSTGTQWIDTGYIPNQQTRWELDYQFSTIGSGSNGMFQENPTVRFNIGQGTDRFFNISYGANNALNIASDTLRHLFVADIPNLQWRLDSSSGAFPAPVSTALQYSLRIFCRNSPGGTVYNLHSGRCFASRMYQSDVLSQRLLPVRVGASGAMMDVLTRRIYRNAGTGAFGYGNDLKYPIPAE